MIRKGIVSSGKLGGGAPSNDFNTLRLNGSTQFVDHGNDSSLQLTSEYTMGCWFKTPSIATTQSLISKWVSNQGYSMYLFSSQIWAQADGVGISNGVALSSNTLYHFVTSFDGATLRVYINGAEINSLAHTGLTDSGTNLLVGNDQGSNFADGDIAVPFVCNRALSSGEISTIYNSGPGQVLQTWEFPQAVKDSLVMASPYNTGAATGRRLEGYDGRENDGTDTASPGFTGDTLTFANNPNKYTVFNFDGTDDFIDCGNDASLQITGDISVTGWFKIGSLGSTQDVMGKWEGALATLSWLVRVEASGELRFYTHNGSTSTFISGPTLVTDKWYFFAARRDSTTMYLSVDNAPPITAAVTGALQGGTTNLTIGNSSPSVSFHFDGDITMPMVFNRLLTINEISSIYNQNLPKLYAQMLTQITDDCVLALELSSNDSSANDLSTASNDGTPNGGVTTGATEINFDNTAAALADFTPIDLEDSLLSLDGDTKFIDQGPNSEVVINSGAVAINTSVLNSHNTYSFNGGGQHLEIANLFSGTAARTMAAVYRSSASGTHVNAICGQTTGSSSGTWFQLQSRSGGATGDPYFAGYAADVTNGDEPDNAWKIVLIIWDGATLTIRSNGAVIATATPSLNSGAFPFWIGQVNGPSEALLGEIAAVDVYNRALSDADAATLENYYETRFAVARNNSLLYFNGTNQYATAPLANFTSHGKSGSISLWAEYTNTGNRDIFFGKGNANGSGGANWSVQLEYTGAGELQAVVGHGSVNADNLVWTVGGTSVGMHHVVLVVDNGNTAGCKLYLDGVDVGAPLVGGSFSWSSYLGAPTYDPHIGARNNNGSPENHFRGMMANTTLFERVITGAEVTELYNSGTLKQVWQYSTDLESSMLAAYGMNTGLGNGRRLEDYSSGENDLSVFNTPGFTDSYMQFELAPNKHRGVKFNGTNHYAEVAVDTPLNITEEISFGGWARCDASPNAFGRLIDRYASTGQRSFGSYWASGADTISGFMSFDGTNLSGELISSTLVRERWYHWMYTWDGVTARLYIDGKLDKSVDVSGTINVSLQPTRIGNSFAFAGEEFTGDMAMPMIFNRALTPGEVSFLYNQNLPKSYSQIPASITDNCVMALEMSSNDNTFNDLSTDADIRSNGSLLMHMDGPDTGTTFYDSGPEKHPITALGSGALSTDQSVFGGAAFEGFGGGGSGLQVGSAGNDVFNFADGDYTIEARVRFKSLSGRMALIVWGYDATVVRRSWTLAYDHGANNLEFYQSSDGSTNNANALRSWTPSVDTWYHIAVCRIGSALRLFVDGVQLGSDATPLNLFAVSDRSLYIGRDFNGTVEILNGYVDEVKILKGLGAYPADFTPATAPYKGAQDAIPANGVDSNGKEINIDNTVAAPVLTLNQSLLLDGVDQYVATADTADFATGSGDFTWGGWFKFNSQKNWNVLMGQYQDSNDRALLYVNSSEQIGFFFEVAGSIRADYISTGVSLENDRLYHIEVRRTNTTTLEIRLNGQTVSLTQNTAIASNLYPDYTAGFDLGRGYIGGGLSYFDGEVYCAQVCSASVDLYQGGQLLNSWEYPATIKGNFIAAWNTHTGIALGRRFEGYGGNELDLTGSGTPAPTISGSLAKFDNAAPMYKAFDFAGTRYVDCGNDASVQNLATMSCSAWVYVTTGGTFIANNGPVIAQGGWGMNYGSFVANQITFFPRIGGSQVLVHSNTLTTDRWYHVCATFDGTDLKMYIDGDLKNTTNNPGSINNATASNLQIGRDTGSGSTAFEGSVLGVKIWARGLTADEVLLDYNKNISKTPTKMNESLYDSLRLHYEMTSNDDTLIDLSGIGNDGTSTNGAAADGLPINVDDTVPYLATAPLLLASASSQYAQASANLADYDLGTADFHISADVKFNSFPDYGGGGLDDIYRIVGEGRGITGIGPVESGWSFYYHHTDNELHLSKYDHPTFTPMSVPFTAVAGVKYQFTVERVGDDIYFYVNGEQVGTAQDASGVSYNRQESNGIYIGYYVYGGSPTTSYLDGEISNVFIATSSGHVTERYNGGVQQKSYFMSQAFQNSLVGAWHLTSDLDSDLRESDFSNGENDMTLFAAPTYTGTNNFVEDSQFEASDFLDLARWHEAIDGFDDKSSYAETATVNGGMGIVTNGVNGLPVYRFDGTDDSFSTPDGAELAYTNGFTWISVAKLDTTSGWFTLQSQDDGGSNNEKIMYGTPQSAGRLDMHTNDAGGNGSFNQAGTNLGTSWKVYTASVAADMSVNHYLNDADDGSGGSLSTPSIPTPTAPHYIGWAEGAGSYLDGDGAEFIVFNRRMTPAQVTPLLRKLVSKFAIS